MNRLLPFTVFLFLTACGRKDPPGMIKFQHLGFGLLPPPGWVQITQADAPAFFAQHAARVLEATRDSVSEGRYLSTWFKMDATDAFLPFVYVAQGPGVSLTVDDRALQKVGASLQRNWASAGFIEAKEERAQIVPVDDLKGMRFEYAVTLNARLASGGRLQTFKARISQFMIVRENASTVVGMQSDQTGSENYSVVLDQVLASFRVFRIP